MEATLEKLRLRTPDGARPHVQGARRARWLFRACVLALVAAALVASAPLVALAENASVDAVAGSTENGGAELSTTVRVTAVDGTLRIEDKTDDFAGSVSDVNAILAREPLRMQVVGGEGSYTYAWSLDVDGAAVPGFSDTGSSDRTNVEVTHEVVAHEIEREGTYRYALSVRDTAGNEVEAEVRVVVSSDYRWADGDPLAGDAYDEDLYFHDDGTQADIKIAGSVHKNARLVVDGLAPTTPAYLSLVSAAQGAPITGAWVVRLVVDGQTVGDVDPFIGPVTVSVRYPGESAYRAAYAFEQPDGVRVQQGSGGYSFPDGVLFMAADASVSAPDYAIDEARRWLTFETKVLGAFATLGTVSEAASHEVSVSSGEGGTVWPAGTLRVADGETAAFAILPEAGYALDDVKATNGTAVRVENNMLYVGPVAADTSVSVSFARVEVDPAIEYTLTARVESGLGTVSVAGGEAGRSASVKAAKGSSVPVSFGPEAGWVVDALTVNGVPAIPLAGGYLVSSLDEDTEVAVSYRRGAEPPATVFSISASVEGRGGEVSPAYVQVPLGGSASVSFVPDAGYAVSEVVVDGVAIPDAPSFYSFDRVSRDHNVNVSFAWVGPGPEPDPDVPDPDEPDVPDVPDPDNPDAPDPSAYFSVNVTSEGAGSVSPTGRVVVAAGAAQTFWFYPDTGWRVERVDLDGEALAGAPDHWSLEKASSDHVLHVMFARDGTAFDEGAEGGLNPIFPLSATGDARGGIVGTLGVLAAIATASLFGARRAHRKSVASAQRKAD